MTVNHSAFTSIARINCRRLTSAVITHALFTAIIMVSATLPVNAADRSPLVVVSTAKTDSVIRQVPLSGTITSARVAKLSTEVSGQVEAVNVEVGDLVETGSALITLDREIEQLTLQALQAETKQASAELSDAKRRYQDAKGLRKQNSISENDLRLLEAEVEVDAAILKQQQVEQRRQQARIDRHILQAPFSGVISERLTEAGEWIEPGRPVLTLVAIDDLRIEFRVPQEFYSSIDKQTTLDVTLDAFPGREFAGTIDAVVPVSDPTSRTFLIHATVDAGDARMTPGMSVHGKLHLSTGRRGVVISRDAILRYPDGRVTVWVIDPDSEPGSEPGSKTATVSEKHVTTGHSFDGQLTIRDGISAGDVIVVQGNESLQDGQQVRIQRHE
ncbi:MAG: efflux RND transporter periplasmic adaptor subunit [Gammaproteobacteria bacterium]|nr:efflux RND transporter periplasmic adaptor subunit [Gammaproteobacteria bacterium]MBT8133956.1 efflux RND transporter periplasmic adaptor subunit [Gammaproteobacteria bacterium]NNJ49572.1 efflux RND transporter periplasmic adaptor subunit [Gammaproteobacteria bacterium]